MAAIESEDDSHFFDVEANRQSYPILYDIEIQKLKNNLLNLNLGAQSMGCVLHSLQMH
jgi:hypothetical protein